MKQESKTINEMEPIGASSITITTVNASTNGPAATSVSASTGGAANVTIVPAATVIAVAATTGTPV